MKHFCFYILKTLVSILLLTQVAFSQGVTIIGNLDCGMWIESRSQNASESLEHYTWGFYNGMTQNSRFDFWKKPYPISPEQTYLWLDKYCRENPLSDAIRGMVILFNERKSESN